MRIHPFAVVMILVLAVLGFSTDALAQGGGGGGGGGTTGGTGGTNSAGELLSSAGEISSEDIMSNEGTFIGTSTSGDTEFVGSSGTTTTTGNTGRNTGNTGRNTTMGNTGRNTTNRNTTNRNTTNRGGTTSNRAVNSKMRVAFSVTAPSAEDIAESLTERLTNAPRITALSNLEVVVQGREATLQGLVATTYDRALAEQIALLEVGVVRVKNQLEVVEELAEPE
jgi:osmotically-inducible protein OsmY